MARGQADGGLKFIDSPRPDLPADVVLSALGTVWGIEGEVTELAGDRDQNFRIDAADGGRYVLKIGHADEDPAVIEMQVGVLEHATRYDPSLPIPPVVRTRDGAAVHAVGHDGTRYPFRLFGFLEGTPLERGERSAAVLRDAGRVSARLDKALRGYFHPAAGHEMMWDIRRAPQVRRYADAIADADRRKLAVGLIDDFEADVLPRLDGFRSQVIHNDITSQNVLFDPDAPDHVTGVIDFGDVVHAPLVQEVALAMIDVTIGLDDPWAGACEIAAAYDEVMPLHAGEIEMLYDLALARQALSVIVMAALENLRPGGLGYEGEYAEPSWTQVDRLLGLGRERAMRMLRRACRTPEPVTSATEAAARKTDIAERRGRLLMPGLSLFYDDPIHVVRGEGMWLVDAAGKRYLDCYNNVPQVGHAHPHVVNALSRQAAAVNTNTRYLYDSILEYAERLGTTLPGDLGVCMFVNSGSEANDLALRMAEAHTGSRGVIVMEDAYHGCTAATAAISPVELEDGPPPHVREIMAPDDYRGPWKRGEPDLGARYAADADRAIGDLAESGHGTSAFVIDSTFCSNGILDAPDGYLRIVFDKVRAAGGLCIADEVQAGFGRYGTMWGYERYGVTPDIVTLGKPVADGYPVGVVITTPAIMASFAAVIPTYFSTFGGNPVGCMAGLAVLDVIEREELCANARKVGARMQDGLRALKQRHAIVGDVRGYGLMAGVELVRDRETMEPAGDENRAVLTRLAQEGVLVGHEGRHGNIMKIRPPIVCREEHADRLVETLDRVLAGFRPA